MLSRAADSLYWMSRYLERAENIARFIEVNQHLSLDLPVNLGDQWHPLVQVTGDEALFKERYEAPTRANVIQFLTFDTDYPNSILSCLYAARENARGLRQIISTEIWEEVNAFYWLVRNSSLERALDMPHDFFSAIKRTSLLLIGVKRATMSHGEPWHFGHLGRKLERADKTSRILDVKYFILLPRVSDVGTAFDNSQWGALLQSASALEMYRQRFGRIDPHRVVEFLVMESNFPRAIYRCLLDAESSLRQITGSAPGTFRNLAEKRLGRLLADLAYTSAEEIINRGLHQYLDDLQTQLDQVHEAIDETFFALRAV
ncbi:MAG: alpha-E domain-containing protein [Candidatus Latescibacteria bacterium]|nr:alpha-E domain-containing protein [Candidatus Latescibacterota bacterium]